MPIKQLESQSGGLGSAIGLVGGFLAANAGANKQRADSAKAQDYKQSRDKATDAAQAARDKDVHDNITSEIATRNANAASTTADTTNTQFQQGAYAKLSGMLHSPPPAGTTAQQWVAHIQQQVPTLGLTDPTLLGKLYGEAQGLVADDQTKRNAAFAGAEMQLPSDPAKKLSVLMKRLQVEKGKPGFDLKPTESMIADTQKQITEAQAAAHQAALERQGDRRLGQGDQRIQISVDRGNAAAGRASAAAGDPQSLADVSGRLRKAKTRDEAQGILDSPEGSLLNDRQYARLQKQVDETYGGHAEAHKAPKIDTSTARGKDQEDAVSAINRGGDRDKIIQHWAAKWNVPLDKASALFP